MHKKVRHLHLTMRAVPFMFHQAVVKSIHRLTLLNHFVSILRLKLLACFAVLQQSWRTLPCRRHGRKNTAQDTSASRENPGWLRQNPPQKGSDASWGTRKAQLSQGRRGLCGRHILCHDLINALRKTSQQSPVRSMHG
jgi:hypothetical protein